MDKCKCRGHKGKLVFWFASFYSEFRFSLRPIHFYLTIEA